METFKMAVVVTLLILVFVWALGEIRWARQQQRARPDYEHGGIVIRAGEEIKMHADVESIPGPTDPPISIELVPSENRPQIDER